ncbi:MAG: OmpA family protein [Kiritimatiellae bacterium]|jgi:peptidoglycan-associated lipoprotein|nr:OmpA family protein [Kiritimatiellia bacterium]
MHKMRVAVIVNIAVVSLLVFTDTGCKSKNAKGGIDGEGPTLIEGDAMMDDLAGINGAVDGTSFRDMYKPVQGVAFAPVYFSLDSYTLPANEISKINMVGQHLNANASHVLIIEGNCDERGSNEYNLSLGENRALAVRSYLINMGVSPDRIQTISFGEEKPAVMGMDESAWRMNRRGEFALFQK